MSKINKMIFALLLSITTVPSLAVAQQHTTGRFYPNPGIVAYKNGSWVGSDHLYNVSDNIEVVVEIFKPDDTFLPISENAIQARIVESFKKARIQPVANSKPGSPPLPFFHMLVMLYPIEKGYVGYCEGRLFEGVKLDRFEAEKDTAYQAITWESVNLMLSPKEDLINQVNKSVDEITDTFVERFEFYKGIKSQLQD